MPQVLAQIQDAADEEFFTAKNAKDEEGEPRIA
jgi:hypothetical protein